MPLVIANALSLMVPRLFRTLLVLLAFTWSSVGMLDYFQLLL